MKMRSRKKSMNLALKAAIVTSKYRTSRGLSPHVRIGEIRLSDIIHFRATPTDEEKDRLAQKLDVPRDTLFPVDREATA